MFPLILFSLGRSFVQDKNGNLRNSGPWKGPQIRLRIQILIYTMLRRDFAEALAKANILGSFNYHKNVKYNRFSPSQKT